jgi:hypothetical protein
MAVYTYDSQDSGAPTLTNTAGSLANILKVCLVGTAGTAYGSKASAGWTAPVDNANDKLLRNNATDGSGCYFRIKDDGYQENTQGTASYQTATITGAKDYTDINTLIIPFPRTITGDNRHSNTYYGGVIFKTSASNGTDTRPWRIIADSTTCYLFLANNGANNSSITSNDYSGSLRVYGFGDLGLLNNVVGYPRGFVAPGIFSAYSSWWIDAFCASIASVGVSGYMEHPLDNSTKSTQMYVLPGISSPAHHGASVNTNTIGYYHLYPSPITGGVVFEDIFVCDDTNNVARTTKHTGYQTERFAKFRGVKGCLNSLLSTATNKLGSDWDTVTVDGRDYLLIRLFGSNGQTKNYGTYAFDLTGPW